MNQLLSIRGLRTYFYTESGVAKAVDGVDLDIAEGEVLGLVGESGSGKSVTALSVLRLIPDPPGRIVAGEIIYRGRDLLKLSQDEIREIRGNDISMVFQEPMTSLNPVFTIGMQVMEVILAHEDVPKDEAAERAVQMLERVGIPRARDRASNYPHEFSGGMRQRAAIALALACEPRVLLADEPTTALDVMVQAQILELLVRLTRDLGLSMILVTHDLPVVAQVCDRAAVMYAGEIVEMGAMSSIYHDPRHPYTRMLFGATPDLLGDADVLSIPGAPPRLDREIVGCPFAPRCDSAFAPCATVAPRRLETSPGHEAVCHLNDHVVAKEPA